ncbi:CbtA family protein [Mycobacterium ostraviense]|uniref:Cobalt transporter n=1 Tax=Mycobacterium ostraviense TaxID=2738409 RepID=A0A164BE74_9MYCO|nr:CbtA family protein [Mycobacterium ostraviense]KZS63396.1 cobalt transporter [Mycobacterium ostraviense]UGT91824.1 CbtA family protein [Mycobacterium ostraviense]
MEKRLIVRGLLAGAVAAVLAFVFARVFAEPVVGRAIDFEDRRADVAHALGLPHEHRAELFTRGVQANAGLGFGVLIFGVAMGALFAILFCLAYRHAEGIPPRDLSLRLAAGAFTAVYLVPFVKYPPNPPAVGESDTLGTRTLWYLVAVLASVVVAILAAWLGRRLAGRLGAFNAGLSSAGAYVVVITLVMPALPAVNETPEPMRDASGAIGYPGFPADVLYEFRLVSLGTQLVLWVTIGLVFSVLAGRLLDEGAERVKSSG